MSDFGSNNSKYNDINEFKWTVLSQEEDIDDNSYKHQRQQSFWKNSSPDFRTKNFADDFNFYSSLTSDSVLSLNIDNYTLINGTEIMFNNASNNNTLEYYYFYKVRFHFTL